MATFSLFHFVLKNRMIRELHEVIRRGIQFCEVSGGYITAFTLLLPQIIINIRSAIFNQYE